MLVLACISVNAIKKDRSLKLAETANSKFTFQISPSKGPNRGGPAALPSQMRSTVTTDIIYVLVVNRGAIARRERGGGEGYPTSAVPASSALS